MVDKSKYNRDRNRWRRVYGLQRRRPKNLSIEDPEENETVTFDLQRTQKNYNPYIRKKKFPVRPFVIGEYIEGTIAFNNEDTKTHTFSESFTNAPIVVLTVEPANDNSDNIIPFLTNVTKNDINIGLSAPFDGDIRFRAVYSDSYPTIVSSSISGSFTVSATRASVPKNATTFTGSYSELASISEVRNTILDDDLDTVKEVFDVSELKGRLSAPLKKTKTLHIIAVK